MPHRTGPTNEKLAKLISELKQAGYKGDKFSVLLAKELEKPTRRRREVSLSNINRTARDGEIIVVPGKVLDGKIEKKVTIAAWKFSAHARGSVEKAGGETMTIHELLKSGKKARIVG